MIIDKTNPEHTNYPDSVDGMVLLEDLGYGGIIIATLEEAAAVKTMTTAEQEAIGWDQYINMINSLDLSGIEPDFSRFLPIE